MISICTGLLVVAFLLSVNRLCERNADMGKRIDRIDRSHRSTDNAILLITLYAASNDATPQIVSLHGKECRRKHAEQKHALSRIQHVAAISSGHATNHIAHDAET